MEYLEKFAKGSKEEKEENHYERMLNPVGTSEKHSAAHVHQNLGSVVFSAKALMFYFMVIFIYTPDG